MFLLSKEKELISELPLVSICIPTYNRAEKLQRAVTAILNCDYPNFEIVISDNASTDGTRILCESWATSDTRIRYYRHEVNQGIMKNFPFARGQARGKYFLWHGDDDYLDKGFISACVAELQSDNGLALVTGMDAYHRGDNVVEYYGKVLNLVSPHPWFRALKFCWLIGNGALFCGVYDRQMVEDCSFPDIFPGDFLWIIEVALVGKLKVLPEHTVFREFGNSLSSSKGGYHASLRHYGYPKWYPYFPWIAKALNLSRYIFVSSIPAHEYGGIGRFLFASLVAGTLLARGALNLAVSVLSRIPGLRTIYRYLLKPKVL